MTDHASTMLDRVFAAGVILESAANLADGPAAARLQDVLNALDALVCDARTAAFGLPARRVRQAPDDATPRS